MKKSKSRLMNSKDTFSLRPFVKWAVANRHGDINRLMEERVLRFGEFRTSIKLITGRAIFDRRKDAEDYAKKLNTKPYYIEHDACKPHSVIRLAGRGKIYHKLVAPDKPKKKRERS